MPSTEQLIRNSVARGLSDATPPIAIQNARLDSNDFCEYCFTDAQTGAPIKQAWHHREWQRLTDEHDRLVAWFPIEHGKSTQTKMKLCRLLGQHGDRQYAYISSKHSQSSKMVGAVKREIESNKRLQEVYPLLRPQRQEITTALEEWGRTSIRVAQCPRGSKDPSLVGYGLSGQILGARLHGVILDNILDKDNTRSRALRDWTVGVLEDEILGRILPGGFVWILDTAWFVDDLLHVLSKREGWHAVRFDAEDGHGLGATLWPSQFPTERLDQKRRELGQTAYDRQFRNRPLSESMNFFKSEFWDACFGRCQWIEEWEDGSAEAVELRTGVDLATRKGESHDLSVFATVIGRGPQRQLVNMQAARMEGTEILRRMVRIYRDLHRPVNLAGGNAKFIVEDNAAQVYIVQMLRDAAILKAIGLTDSEASDIRVAGRTTTSKRRDAELGIPGLASGIEMGRWDFAAHDEVRNLREEMKAWSPEADHYGDRLMALWHAASDIMDARDTFRVDYV